MDTLNYIVVLRWPPDRLGGINEEEVISSDEKKTLLHNFDKYKIISTVPFILEYLDLNENILYGWEEEEPLGVVEHYCQLIRDGYEAPPVPVSKIHHEDFLENSYMLTYLEEAIEVDGGYSTRILGGHRRALAYHKLGKPLPALIPANETQSLDKIKLPPLEEIIKINKIKLDEPHWIYKNIIYPLLKIMPFVVSTSSKEKI